MDHTDAAIPTPGFKQKRQLLQGTEVNEFLGVMTRAWAQFKSFPLTMHHVHTRRALSDPKNAQRFKEGRFLRSHFGNWPFARNFAGLMIGSMAAAYVGDSLIQFSKGEKIRDPFDPGTWTTMFVLGGAGGLYSDFLLGQYNRWYNNPITRLGGPSADDVAEGFYFWSDVLHGNVDVNDTFSLIGRNTIPGQNLFWVQRAKRAMFARELGDSLNPGWAERLNNRLDNDPSLSEPPGER
jgi:hypothetical protein